MEHVQCAVCGADDHRLLFEGRDYWYGQPGLFAMRQCRVCGLNYLDPRPDTEEIGAYYPVEYLPYQPAIEDERSRWRRLDRRYAMNKRLRAIATRVPQPGRALDVGCATGTMLAALRSQGWQVQGVETNRQAAAYARDRFGLDVFTGELTAARFPDAHFDLIIFWDVLEHLHQPRQALLEAARIARPGATLLLVLPNPESWEARLFRRYWAGWDTPRHLQVFSQDVTRRLLAETCWRATETTYLTGRHWLLSLSLQHWLAASMASDWRRKAWLRLFRSPPLRLLLLPYFATAERLGRASIMALFARREAGATSEPTQAPRR